MFEQATTVFTDKSFAPGSNRPLETLNEKRWRRLQGVGFQFGEPFGGQPGKMLLDTLLFHVELVGFLAFLSGWRFSSTDGLSSDCFATEPSDIFGSAGGRHVVLANRLNQITRRILGDSSIPTTGQLVEYL